MKQINLKLPENLFVVAERYVENYGFRNIQELAAEAIREKIFERSEFDESFSREEIDYIEKSLSKAIKKNKFISEEEMNKVLLG